MPGDTLTRRFYEQVETMGKILTAVLGRAPLGY